MPRRKLTAGHPLSRERLVQEALALVDADGLSALSMRRLAARLGVDPMALYYYVPSKAELVSLIVRKVFAGLPDLPRTGDWRARIQFWTAAYRDLVLAHPNLILPMLSDVEAVSAALQANQAFHDAMQASGLPQEVALLGGGVLVDFVHGFVLAGEAVRQETEYFRFGIDVILDGLEARRG